MATTASNGREANPGANGRVGMMGTSYLGWTQTAAAVMNPPHLATLVVNQAGANAYSSSVRHNGAMELRFLAWAFMGAATGSEAISLTRVCVAALEPVRASDWLDALPWIDGTDPVGPCALVRALGVGSLSSRRLTASTGNILVTIFEKLWGNHADVPTLFSGAWYDSYTRATIENYVGLSERLSSPVHLLLGPWTHGSTTVDQTFSGNVDYGSSCFCRRKSGA